MKHDQKIVILDQLGDGLTSTVSKCRIGEDIFAIKVFKDSCTLKSRIREVQALTNLKDCDVIKLVAYDPQYNWVVLELLYKKDLFDFVASEKKSFSEPMAKYMLTCMSNAVGQMHLRGFAHRDIKLENILLCSNTFEPKVCDLGFTESINGLVTRSMGTNGYMGPELQALTFEGLTQTDRIKGEITTASDVFALGVCLFILTFAHPPFLSTKKSDNCPYWKCIYAGKWETFWKACEKNKAPRSKELKNLLQGMLNPNLQLRPTIQQVLQSNWLNGGLINQDTYFKEMCSRRLSFGDQ